MMVGTTIRESSLDGVGGEIVSRDIVISWQS
jgi:hypothetical protein